jgi:hypothetical protein
MAENLKVHMGEGSPENVAFKLFQEIAYAEDVNTHHGPGGSKKPDQEWILDTYARCRRAVMGIDHRKK